MNQWKHEWGKESFEHFSNDGASPDRKGETEDFEGYGMIRQGFHNHPIPPYDSGHLAQMMFDSAIPHKPIIRTVSPFRLSWNFALTFASGLAILLCVIVLGIQFASISSNGIKTARLSPIESASKMDPSWLWAMRLRMGNLVTIPPYMTGEFELIDGSTLHVSAGAQIAIQFGHDRRVQLKRGSIHVWAAKNKETPMIVCTPLADVIVTGTVFNVQVLP